MLTRRTTLAFLTLAAVSLVPQGLFAQQHSKVIDLTKPNAPLLRFYIGTYTKGDSKGIYASDLNLHDGTLLPPRLVAEIENPSFLVTTPDRKNLYAVGEISNFADQDTGAVSAFAIEEDGSLRLINQEASGGRGPCHVSLPRSKNFVMVSNYGGGSFATLPLGEEGQLAPATSLFLHEGSSINEGRQKGPHGHGMYLVPGSLLALSVDLGLDKVMIYRILDPKTGEMELNDPPFISVKPGSGPRHLAMNELGTRVYLLNELDSTLDVYAFDPSTGASEHLQRVATLPEDFVGNNTTAEVYIHPRGQWLYCSNRGDDSIVTFRIDHETGLVLPIDRTSTFGKTPRHFQITPDGRYLLVANQDTNNIVVLEIDQKIGTLKTTGNQILVPNPCCIEFLP
ncbi:lactonase family protein [Bremerella sp. JC817]|uniref:lactonase family protein n=1 Tax=Bremerella sp. JC817 TaxID=3231756 RepID=UPI003459134E